MKGIEYEEVYHYFVQSVSPNGLLIRMRRQQQALRR